ncbi:hypothetical protein DNTS_010138 [Danionella cerebrum]|uniref:Uncharacterized protein n=1 Tax=Danionella cerebrum TaxID=2873325 RepID=A0A553Q9B7_9TELE|nr:hypothetical protein DNTS_010138 [Danionella translucida]
MLGGTPQMSTVKDADREPNAVFIKGTGIFPVTLSRDTMLKMRSIAERSIEATGLPGVRYGKLKFIQ